MPVIQVIILLLKKILQDIPVAKELMLRNK
jgi:hypothetical protein